jgi:hypothetical protein
MPCFPKLVQRYSGDTLSMMVSLAGGLSFSCLLGRSRVLLANDNTWASFARDTKPGVCATLRLAALLIVATLLAGCGTFGLGDGEDLAPGEVTPTSSGVYTDDTYLHVHLEPQNESQGPVSPSDHPVQLSAAQVEASLADLKVKPKDGDRPIPLIPDDLLPELSVLIAQALGDAALDEDVVFHSFRKAGPWYGSHRRATTARVFYRDGKLNFIFGDLDDFYSEQIDRNLHPLNPGYRGEASELSGHLIDSPQVAFVNSRRDWIRIDTTSTATAAPAATSPAAESPTTPAPAASASQTSQDPRWTQLEERLLILDGLRRKGLITGEDYETKKQELLEVLDL